MADAEPSSIQEVADFLNDTSASYAEWENIFTEMDQDFAPPSEHFLKDKEVLISLREATIQVEKDALTLEVTHAHVVQRPAFVTDWRALRDQIDSFGTYLYAIEPANYNRFQLIRRIAGIALFAKRCTVTCTKVGQAEQRALDRQGNMRRPPNSKQRKKS